MKLLFLFPLTASLAMAQVPELATAKPTRGPITRFISLPGVVRANQQATLFAKVPGFLKSITVDKGGVVKAGDVLAELEAPELGADLGKAEAELKEAEIEVKRLHQAREKSATSVTEQQISIAEGKAEAAQATLTRAKTMLAYCKISAPFDGMITARYVDVGAFIPAATNNSPVQSAMLVTLADFTTVRVQVMIPENESTLVAVGQPIKLAHDAIKDKSFEAKVSRMSYALDESTRTMLMEADLPNADLRLRPGMMASVKVGVEQHPSALLVPVAALVMEKLNAFVFTVADGKARKTPVKLGFNDGTNVEITDGLPAESSVLLVGKLVLTDGQAVQVK